MTRNRAVHPCSLPVPSTALFVVLYVPGTTVCVFSSYGTVTAGYFSVLVLRRRKKKKRYLLEKHLTFFLRGSTTYARNPDHRNGGLFFHRLLACRSKRIHTHSFHSFRRPAEMTNRSTIAADSRPPARLPRRSSFARGRVESVGRAQTRGRQPEWRKRRAP